MTDNRLLSSLAQLYRSGREHRSLLVVILLGGWLLAGLLTWVAIGNSNLRGDEYTYVAGARALADAIAGRQATGVDLADHLIGNGWFMPGGHLLGVPLFLVAPDASYAVIRGWMLAVNGVMFLGVLALARPVLGTGMVMALLVFPGLAPLWHVASAMHLPDLPAGLLGFAGILLAMRLAGNILHARTLSWKTLLAMELCLLAALYLRGPMLAVMLALNCVLLALCLGAATRRWASAGKITLGLAAVLACVLPWSATVSAHFDRPVFTTTNVPLVFADGFGDPRRTCFGPCDPGVDIVPAWEFARETAGREGRNPLDVEREMMRYSVAGLTPRTYFATVRENMGRFFLDPGGWLRGLLDVTYGLPENLRSAIYHLLVAITLVTYVPFMLALVAGNILLFRQTDSLRVQSILVKGVTACLSLQPFIHKSSARYWVALAPLAALSLVMLWAAGIRRVRGEADAAASVVPRWLDLMQLIYAIGFSALGAAILLA